MQELAIEQIDPAGANFAMFLNSLSPREQTDFETWTTEFIGYSIRPARSIGQVRLMLREGESRDEYNLADVGYGLSQILPVMGQIWLNTRRRAARSEFRVVAIEQPELHLHPAFQTRIADALVGALAATERIRNYTLSLVVETHSEAVINRLGELIAAGRLSQGTVAIYLFEKQGPDEVTTVRMSEFDKDGVLENWPFGFFSGRVQLPSQAAK
jgi:predicted ATPase